jgi:hypothetical protein
MYHEYDAIQIDTIIMTKQWLMNMGRSHGLNFKIWPGFAHDQLAMVYVTN